MVAQIDRSVPVISLDTEKLFAETIAYRAQLIERLGFTDVRIIKPDAGSVQLLDPEGSLHRRSPDLCCRIRKIEPLQRALEGFSAWISGRKRFHGGSRVDIPTLEVLDGRLKIEPLARFSAEDIKPISFDMISLATLSSHKGIARSVARPARSGEEPPTIRAPDVGPDWPRPNAESIGR